MVTDPSRERIAETKTRTTSPSAASSESDNEPRPAIGELAPGMDEAALSRARAPGAPSHLDPRLASLVSTDEVRGAEPWKVGSPVIGGLTRDFAHVLKFPMGLTAAETPAPPSSAQRVWNADMYSIPQEHGHPALRPLTTTSMPPPASRAPLDPVAHPAPGEVLTSPVKLGGRAMLIAASDSPGPEQTSVSPIGSARKRTLSHTSREATRTTGAAPPLASSTVAPTNEAVPTARESRRPRAVIRRAAQALEPAALALARDSGSASRTSDWMPPAAPITAQRAYVHGVTLPSAPHLVAAQPLTSEPPPVIRIPRLVADADLTDRGWSRGSLHSKLPGPTADVAAAILAAAVSPVREGSSSSTAADDVQCWAALSGLAASGPMSLASSHGSLVGGQAPGSRELLAAGSAESLTGHFMPPSPYAASASFGASTASPPAKRLLAFEASPRNARAAGNSWQLSAGLAPPPPSQAPAAAWESGGGSRPRGAAQRSPSESDDPGDSSVDAWDDASVRSRSVGLE